MILASLAVAGAAYFGRIGLQAYARRAQVKMAEAAATAAKVKMIILFYPEEP